MQEEAVRQAIEIYNTPGQIPVPTELGDRLTKLNVSRSAYFLAGLIIENLDPERYAETRTVNISMKQAAKIMKCSHRVVSNARRELCKLGIFAQHPAYTDEGDKITGVYQFTYLWEKDNERFK